MEARLADHGLIAEMAFEIEWMLSVADDDGFEAGTTGPAYGMTRLIELSDYCVDLLRALEAQGISVEQLHPEYAPGQFEVSVGAAGPLATADRNVLARQTIRAVGERHGLRTSFSPAVIAGGVGNGMHLHMSLWDGDRNETAGGTGPYGITRRFESFLAGVLDELPALLALTAPSVASYLRLQPHRWAGPYRCWGVENREAALRLILDSNAELKVIDATASPYLAIGAVIAAGLAGIDRDLRLPQDIHVDPGSLTAEDLAARGIERLPRNLPEVLTHYEHSNVLTEAFGVALHETIAAVRRAECELFDGLTDDEIAAATRWRH
jgi:glutamine synthetase